MAIKNTETSYGSIARLLHWIIFLLVLIIIPLGYFMDDVSDKVLRAQVVNIHKLIGVLILLLMLLRVLWTLYNVRPALPFQTPAWQKAVELIVQVSLYLGLIIMPLSGLVGSVAAGKPPHLGNFDIELPISHSKALADFAFDDVHVPLAVILIVLISFHILAAFYHHFIKRDDILRRMVSGGGHR